MKTPKAEEVKRAISVLWESLQCPICLDLMTTPVSTKCDHQFCKFCMMKLLNSTRRKEANCPVCKTKISKRSLQESPGFQRLVAGLQNMVQAFEHDTSTNYFTGMSQQKRQTCVTEAEAETNLCNGDKASIDMCGTCEKDEKDLAGEKDEGQHRLPASLSSSVAAKDGFAKLMGLEDSYPFNSDNDGFDSGLGDAPTTEKETDCKAHNSHGVQEPAAVTDTSHIGEEFTSRSSRRKRNAGSDDSSCQQIFSPEKGEKQPVRRSSRNSKKEKSTPEKILDQRQKKSLEKVSEWLMKNSPLEENSEAEKNKSESHATEDSASLAGSGSPTSVLKGNLEIVNRGSKRKEHVKGLQEQVFGAVYKRERRGVLAFSPQNRRFKDSPALCLSEETQATKSVPKERMSEKLTPTDFVNINCFEENDERVLKNHQGEKNLENFVLKETEKTKFIDPDGELSSSIADGHENNLTELPEKDNSEEEQEDSLVFDVLLQQGKRMSRKKMHNTWQNVDGDLQAQAKTKLEMGEKNKLVRKKNEGAKANMGKAVKVSNPLVLVGVKGDESNHVEIPKTVSRTVETEVQIENYPSSQETGSPIMRRTRRSRRLQLFTEEVQGCHKKASTERNTILSTDENKVPSFNRTAADSVHIVGSQVDKEVNSMRRNGCVYNEDLGEIENMESKQTKMTMQQTSIVEDYETPVSNTKFPCEATVSCLEAVVPTSTSPEAVGPLLETVDQSSSASIPPTELQSHASVETSAREARCAELEKDEEDVNDSELDTEQLVKSFKAIKRKSFSFGSPTLKRSYPRLDKEDQKGKTSKGNSLMGSGTEVDTDQHLSHSKEPLVVQKESITRMEVDNSCCSDLIPPSRSPNYINQKSTLTKRRGLKQSVLNRPSKEGEETLSHKTQESVLSRLSGSSVGSVLSPNKVAKSQVLNTQPVDSGPLFPLLDATQEDLPVQISVSTIQFDEKQEQCQMHGSLKKTPGRSQNPKAYTALEPQECPGTANKIVANSESSLTPDGLLPPVIQTVASQGVESGQSSSEASVFTPMKNNPKQRTRRKAPRLQSSSESDCNSEDEDLPSLAKIFRCFPCPPAEEKASAGALRESADLPSDQVQDQQSPSKAYNVNKSGPAEQDGIYLACSSPPEWANSSQASVDLFGTPEECEVGVSEIGLSMESSQFSSEVIPTQQKIAMQEELKRLEKMMALVSEALEAKESGSNPPLQPQTDKFPVSSGQDLHMTSTCGGENCARKGAPEGGNDSALLPHGSGDSGGLGPTQPSLTKQEGTRGLGRRCTQSQSERSLRSIEANKIPVGSEVKRGKQMTNTTNASSSEGRESKENRADAPSTNTNSTHGPQRDIAGTKLVLVASGLGSNELSMLKKFAKRVGGSVCSQVSAETTHVIMSTDGQLVCERTLKYFLGIAGRKWVVSFQWISECFKHGKLLKETPFEVRGDVVNGPDHQGPRRSRSTGDRDVRHPLFKHRRSY